MDARNFSNVEFHTDPHGGKLIYGFCRTCDTQRSLLLMGEKDKTRLGCYSCGSHEDFNEQDLRESKHKSAP